MKTLVIILGLGLTIGMVNDTALNAQSISINVHVNLDRQPAWGPSGYDFAAFYYFPAINVYYDVNKELFYYLNRRKWVASYYLPAHYHKYNLYTLYKVVLNEHARPWIYNRVHARTYSQFKRVKEQQSIFHMNDHRYYRAKNNTRAWVEPRDQRDRKPVIRESNKKQNKNTSRNSKVRTDRTSASSEKNKKATSKTIVATKKKHTDRRKQKHQLATVVQDRTK